MEEQALAKRIYTRFHNKQNKHDPSVAIDPGTIILILELIKLLAETYNKCKEKRSVEKTLIDPSTLEKIILKRVIRKKLGFWKNFFEGKYYFEAFLEEGKRQESIKTFKSILIREK